MSRSGRLQAEVALIADPTDPFERIAPEAEWNRPYSDRPKVTLEVEPSDSLASVLERAAQDLGIARFSAAHSKIAFYKADDEVAFAPRPFPRFLLSELTLVDEHGRALFGVGDLRSVRYSDLLRAAEAGVLDGDPLRPYLIIEPGYGDWIGPDWPTLLEGLRVTWQVVEHLATAGGAIAIAKVVRDEVRRRLLRGQEAIEANAEWAHRRTMPYQFIALIRSRDWRTTDLAALLSCTEPETEAVLWALGFSFDAESQTWRHRGDHAAEVMEQVFTEVQLEAHERGDELGPELRRRLAAYFERGEPLPLSESALADEDFEYRPTPGERIGELIDGAIESLRAALEAWRSRQS